MTAKPGGARKLKVVIPSPPDSAWHAGIARLLQDQPRLDVVIVPAQGEPCIQEIARLRPEWVILLAEVDCAHYSPPLADVFSAVPGATVVLLCQCDNKVRIYRSQETEVESPQDLLDLIKEER